MKKLAIGLMIGIGIFLYFAIVANMTSVKLIPNNEANQLQQQEAYGQIWKWPWGTEEEKPKEEKVKEEVKTRDLTLDDIEVEEGIKGQVEIFEIVEDVAQMVTCEQKRNGTSQFAGSWELELCILVAEKLQDKCKNDPIWSRLDIPLCTGYPDGSNLIEDFIANK